MDVVIRPSTAEVRVSAPGGPRASASYALAPVAPLRRPIVVPDPRLVAMTSAATARAPGHAHG